MSRETRLPLRTVCSVLLLTSLWGVACHEQGNNSISGESEENDESEISVLGNKYDVRDADDLDKVQDLIRTQLNEISTRDGTFREADAMKEAWLGAVNIQGTWQIAHPYNVNASIKSVCQNPDTGYYLFSTLEDCKKWVTQENYAKTTMQISSIIAGITATDISQCIPFYKIFPEHMQR
jgi:hypothetical protein